MHFLLQDSICCLYAGILLYNEFRKKCCLFLTAIYILTPAANRYTTLKLYLLSEQSDYYRIIYTMYTKATKNSFNGKYLKIFVHTKLTRSTHPRSCIALIAKRCRVRSFCRFGQSLYNIVICLSLYTVVCI